MRIIRHFHEDVSWKFKKCRGKFEIDNNSLQDRLLGVREPSQVGGALSVD